MSRFMKAALVAALTAGTFLTGGLTAQAATCDQSCHDGQLQSRFFPEFGSSLHRAQRTEDRWERLINGCDPVVVRDARNLAYRIDHHWRIRAAFYRVYSDLNPDA